MWFRKKTKKSKFITWTDYSAPISKIIVNTDDIKMVLRCATFPPAHYLAEYRLIDSLRPYRIFFRDGRYLDITEGNYNRIQEMLCQI